MVVSGWLPDFLRAIILSSVIPLNFFFFAISFFVFRVSVISCIFFSPKKSQIFSFFWLDTAPSSRQSNQTSAAFRRSAPFYLLGEGLVSTYWLNKEKIKRINQSTFLVFDLFHALCVPLPSKSAQTYRPLPTIERNNTFFPSFSRSTKATYYYWTHSPLFLIHSERRGNLRVHYSGFFGFLGKKKDFDQQLFMLTSTVRTVKEEEKKLEWLLDDTKLLISLYVCVFFFFIFWVVKRKKEENPCQCLLVFCSTRHVFRILSLYSGTLSAIFFFPFFPNRALITSFPILKVRLRVHFVYLFSTIFFPSYLLRLRRWCRIENGIFPNIPGCLNSFSF